MLPSRKNCNIASVVRLRASKTTLLSLILAAGSSNVKDQILPIYARSLDAAKQHQDQEDDEHQAQTSAGSISP